jgi:hypothetical protein
MTHSPYADALPARDKIADPAAADHARAAERHLRFATGRLGLRLPPGASILDFGCGIGTSVRALLAQGYDAYGVDVLEYWGRDFDKYWHIAEKPPADVAARLKLTDPADNRLPFADATFETSASAIRCSSTSSITGPRCRRSPACSNPARSRSTPSPAPTT